MINNLVNGAEISTLMFDESFDYREVENPIRTNGHRFTHFIDINKNSIWTTKMKTNTYKLNDDYF